METSFHKFDLELKSLYREYCSGIDDTEIIFRDDKDKSFYKNLQREWINMICESRNEDFEQEGAIIILQESPIYLHILSFALLLKPTHDIEDFLEYQIRQNVENAETIIGFLKFYVLDYIKLHSPFDNSIRIKIIQKYIRSFKLKKGRTSDDLIKKKANKKTANDKKVYKYPVLVTYSSNEEIQILIRNISNRLFIAKYFESKTSFSGVFFGFNNCKFLSKELAILAMLLQKLKIKKIIQVKGLENNKGIFKVANTFFVDSEGNRFAPRALINSINKLKKNSIKYSRIEKKIDAIINI